MPPVTKSPNDTEPIPDRDRGDFYAHRPFFQDAADCFKSIHFSRALQAIVSSVNSGVSPAA